jgi:hypothetical protein
MSVDPKPSPPTPPVPPLTSSKDAVKVFIGVLLWFVTLDANRALVATVDFAKLATHPLVVHSPWFLPLPSVAFVGGSVGLLQGLILGIQALVFFWVGPTFFVALGPVLSSAVRTPLQVVAEIRRAWFSKKNDSVDPKPAPIPPKSPRDYLVVFLGVVLWYVTGNANHAVMAAVDYHKFAAHFPNAAGHELLIVVSLTGAAVGVLQGLILAVRALIFLWFGPGFFDALSPVLSAFARIPTKFVADFRRAWFDPKDHPDDPGTDTGTSPTK